MSPDQWPAVDPILDAVLDCEPSERAQALDRLCDDPAVRREVEALLDAEANAPDFLDAGASDLAATLVTGDAPSLVDDPLTGERIGPYRVVRELGRGGMSVVYLAERADGQYEQQVALKLLPRAFETAERVRRFRTERQILASLDHPSIARLLDGGVTASGRPYLVMERVDGVPITDHCAAHGCSLEQRLHLLGDVCQAVQHAHRRLVVHRDLKPSNIFVVDTESGPKVKLLDFGIAKLVDEETNWTVPHTRTGERLLTPQYAAPEQIRGDTVSTATDVYQLGVLAYELLTGRRPLSVEDKTLTEIEQAVIDATPDLPSTRLTGAKAGAAVPRAWQRRLRGDLDTIIMKALRKEPGRRYGSPEALAEDVQRFLRGEPVEARPATLRYRTRKFVQRNRWAVVSSGVGFVLVTLFVVLLAHQRQAALQERDRAQREAATAEQVAGFLVDLFESADPAEARGTTVTAEQLLERGLDRINRLDARPEIQAQMQRTLGQVYRRLGEYDRARHLLEASVDQLRAHPGSQPLERARSLEELGLLRADEGGFEKAESLFRDALSIRLERQSANHVDVGKTKYLLAYALRRQGKYDAAEPVNRQSLDIRRDHYGVNHPATAESLSGLGAVLHSQGEYDEAERLFRDALQARRTLLDAPHPDLAISINNLASLLVNLGRFEEAEPLLREALSMRRALFGADHPKVALTMNNLALALRGQGKMDEAESLVREALAMRRQMLGDEHAGTAMSLYTLGEILLHTDRPQEALERFTEARSAFASTLSPTHSFAVRTAMAMGSAHLALGDIDRAAELLREGFTHVRAIHPTGSLEYALAATQMGRLYRLRGDAAQAESLLVQAYEALRALEPAPTRRQARVRTELTALYDATNRTPHAVYVRATPDAPTIPHDAGASSAE